VAQGMSITGGVGQGRGAHVLSCTRVAHVAQDRVARASLVEDVARLEDVDDVAIARALRQLERRDVDSVVALVDGWLW
jgi:hypothetical protein